ncbi:unnamed protein product [Leptidea sinapis]|uniref:Uncharacterized protein n=1 Tax=Leptidea sinapis TaxID=189913 RepID=A0A5E4QJW4_9NEOP|nr:unnamed protein product [Leptidea sinapis]
MLPILFLILPFYGIYCEPETVRDNFDYFSYGNEENLLKSLELNAPKDDIVLRPQEVKNWPQQSLNVGQITAVSINSLGQPYVQRIKCLSKLRQGTNY